MIVAYYILPVFLVVLLILGIKKNSYEAFISGAKKTADKTAYIKTNEIPVTARFPNAFHQL